MTRNRLETVGEKEREMVVTRMDRTYRNKPARSLFLFPQWEAQLHDYVLPVFHLGEQCWNDGPLACNYTETSWIRVSVTPCDRDTALNTSEDIKRVVWLVWSIRTLRLFSVSWRVCVHDLIFNLVWWLVRNISTNYYSLMWLCFAYRMSDVWNKLVKNEGGLQKGPGLSNIQWQCGFIA